MNKKGKVAMEILMMLVTIVATSSIVLVLVNTGVISVKSSGEAVNILNTEFIPVSREGFLAVKDFKFCSLVDAQFNCVNEKNSFNLGDEIHFLFIVESSVKGGEIMIVENYRVLDPAGKVLLDVDEENNYHFTKKSAKPSELVTFGDYFVIGSNELSGEYTVDLVVANPLLNKKSTLTKRVMIR
jgi:hypothetical protein